MVVPIPEDDGRAIFGTTIHELTHAAHWKIGMTYVYTVHQSAEAEG
jgi:hypothetical protein